jgi:hypothetical protein
MRNLCEIIRTDAGCLIRLDCSVRSLPHWATILPLFACLGLRCQIWLFQAVSRLLYDYL